MPGSWRCGGCATACVSPLPPCSLLVPWPEQSTALLGHQWSRSPRHPRRGPSMGLAPCPHRIVPRHRSALECLAASLMSTASPASTTSMTEGGDTRHGRGGPWPCRTRATGLWEHGEGAHGLSGARTGHPAARHPMACRAGATGPLLRVCPHLHAPRTTPAGSPDRVDRGVSSGSNTTGRSAPVRPGLPRQRIAWERGHERALSSAPCHRRLRAGGGVGMGNHGSPACWSAPADPCRASPSVHQACRPVPLY